MQRIRQIAVSFVFILIATGLTAQSFSLKTDTRIIGKNDILQVEYVVKDGSEISGFIQPVFNDWKIIAGPSTSQSMVSINGQTSKTFSYVYALMPVKNGDLFVPGAAIIADGKKITCKGIAIKVTNQSSVQPAPQPNSSLQSLFNDPALENLFSRDPVLKANGNPAEIMRKNIFLKATPAKTSCFAGEPVLVTYKLYTAIHTESRVTKQPSFTGCSVIELTSDDGPLVENINGKDYRTYIIRKVILIPLQDGKLDLDSAQINNEVSFADAGNPYNVKKYTSTIHNPPAFITVKPLPVLNKPADFSGAIGTFSIDATIKNKEAEAGGNNSLLVTISGEGNMLGIELPSVEWPENIDHFDASRKENVDKSSFPLAGKLIFEIPFIGTAEGKKTIPSIRWNYFDPVKGDYKAIATDSIVINFLKASKQKKLVEETVVREDVSNKKYLWIVAGIALAAFILLSFTLRKGNNVKETAVAYKDNKEELKEIKLPVITEKTDFNISLKILDEMEEPHLFYSSARNLLLQALKQSLEADASFNTLLNILETKTGNTALSDKCMNIYRDCEFALYSGINDDNNRTVVFKKLEELIKELHDEISIKTLT